MGVKKMNIGSSGGGGLGSLLGNVFSSRGLGGCFGGGQLGNVLGGSPTVNGASSGNTAGQSTQDESKFVNHRYRYTVTTLNLLFPEEEEPVQLLTSAVTRIHISRLYDSCLQPILELKMVIPPKMYKKILEFKNELTIHLRIQKLAVDLDGKELFRDDYINGTFSMTSDDTFNFPEEDDYDSVNKAEGGEGSLEDAKKGIYNIANYVLEFYLSLWKSSDLTALREVVNTTVEGGTISTVMAKTYTDAGIEKILISPIDNESSYDQITIPPMNLMNVHEYLQKVYGTHYTGTNIFLDYRCMYILDKSGRCNAYEEGEYKRTVFVVMKPKVALTYRSGTTDDEDAKVYYIFVEPLGVESSSPSNSNDLIGGNNVLIVDPDSNETTEIEGAGKQSGDGNARVVTDNYSNDYNKTTIISDIVEGNSQISITCYDYLEDALTPNKEFILYFDEVDKQELNGYYRLTSSVCTFGKKGDFFDITGKHNFVFKAALSGEETEEIRAKIYPKKSESESESSGKESDANKSESVPDKDGNVATSETDADKVHGPQPKNMGDSTSTVSNAPTSSGTKKDTRFGYDDLGNVKGVDYPEYNRITEDDSKVVVEQKKAAQAKALPSKGPQPKKK